MKLASLKAGRDGRLFVVSCDLGRAISAVASTLQSALDDWDPSWPIWQKRLKKVPRHIFHSIQPNARGAEVPQSFWTDPLIVSGRLGRVGSLSIGNLSLGQLRPAPGTVLRSPETGSKNRRYRVAWGLSTATNSTPDFMRVATTNFNARAIAALMGMVISTSALAFRMTSVRALGWISRHSSFANSPGLAPVKIPQR